MRDSVPPWVVLVDSCGQPGKTSVLLDAVPVESGSPILANGRVG
ncbi:hypothetical protein [Spirulina subsalsa]|nr:hypothetical protein [Spirulina subsalsa]